MITENTTLAELNTLLEKAKLDMTDVIIVGDVAIVTLVETSGQRHQYRGNTLAQAISRAYSAYQAEYMARCIVNSF